MLISLALQLEDEHTDRDKKVYDDVLCVVMIMAPLSVLIHALRLERKIKQARKATGLDKTLLPCASGALNDGASAGTLRRLGNIYDAPLDDAPPATLVSADQSILNTTVPIMHDD